MNSLNEIYKELLLSIYYTGVETSPRGQLCREIFSNVTKIDPNDNIITLPGFETNLNYAKTEFEWYKNGDNHINVNELIQKVWSKFSDDGETVNSNYGHRIYGHKIGFINQWDWVVAKLKKDPDSRQCVMNINAVDDKFQNTKDFPCTMYIQVFIRNNKLEWITNMRSNDVYFGFRNDVYCFCEWMKLLAKELQIETGMYTHFTGSLHLYEKQFEKVQKLIEKS